MKSHCKYRQQEQLHCGGLLRHPWPHPTLAVVTLSLNLYGSGEIVLTGVTHVQDCGMHAKCTQIVSMPTSVGMPKPNDIGLSQGPKKYECCQLGWIKVGGFLTVKDVQKGSFSFL